jgi:hypothetical protein
MASLGIGLGILTHLGDSPSHIVINQLLGNVIDLVIAKEWNQVLGIDMNVIYMSAFIGIGLDYSGGCG